MHVILLDNAKKINDHSQMANGQEFNQKVLLKVMCSS